MSISPWLKSPDLLSKTSSKLAKAQLPKLLRKLAKKHNQAEQATPFFIDTQAKMQDDESAFVFVFGKIKDWKNHAKKTSAQSLALRGFCYAEWNEIEKCVSIYLMPVAGKAKAKEKLLQKELKKIIPPSKAVLHIVAGEFSEDDPNFQALEQASDSATEEVESAEEALADELSELEQPQVPASRNERKQALEAAIVACKESGSKLKNLLSLYAKPENQQVKLVQEITATCKNFETHCKQLPLDMQEKLRAQVEKLLLYGQQIEKIWAKKQSEAQVQAEKQSFETSLHEIKMLFEKAGIELKIA